MLDPKHLGMIDAIWGCVSCPRYLHTAYFLDISALESYFPFIKSPTLFQAIMRVGLPEDLILYAVLLHGSQLVFILPRSSSEAYDAMVTVIIHFLLFICAICPYHSSTRGGSSALLSSQYAFILCNKSWTFRLRLVFSWLLSSCMLASRPCNSNTCSDNT
jgi:hypothetical protein